MLKKRILTAIVLLPIFILLVLTLSSHAFYFLTALIVLGGAWEWSFFMEIKRFSYRWVYLFLMGLALWIAYLFPLAPILYITLVWWLIATYLVIRYPNNRASSIVLRGCMGLFVLVPCWLAVNAIRNHPHGISLLLFLFVLIWGADSGAYFAGRKWGKHKLMPRVSPGKTWEGLLGALLTTLVVALLALLLFKVPYISWPAVLLWSLLTVLFSIVGDLFESMMKRQVGLKDSGRLLPGHGGILDRIDSLTAAAPIFALGFIISHWI